MFIFLNYIIDHHFLEIIKQKQESMAKYIVLCLNSLAKLQIPKGASRSLALVVNCSTCSHMSWPYQSTKLFVISPFQVVCGGLDSVATRKVFVTRRKLT